MFGPENCIYAHSIKDIQETDPDLIKSMASKKKKAIFNNLGIWPTATILAFFTPNEIIEISRVNKEAHYISKKVFGMRCVDLEKIRVTHHSLNFF